MTPRWNKNKCLHRNYIISPDFCVTTWNSRLFQVFHVFQVSGHPEYNLASQESDALCRKGNHMSGVTQAMHHRLKLFFQLRADWLMAYTREMSIPSTRWTNLFSMNVTLMLRAWCPSVLLSVCRVEGWAGFNVPPNTLQVISGMGFYGSNDQTNSVKALKEDRS